MTSDFEWVGIKSDINKAIKNPVTRKKSSFSSDSLDESDKDYSLSNKKSSSTEAKITRSDQVNSQTMNGNRKDDNSSSDVDCDSFMSESLHESDDVSCAHSSYCLEIAEETEALQTELITESVDIRISPTVELMNFHYPNSFDSDFSLVADVEVKNEKSDPEENGDDKRLSKEEEKQQPNIKVPDHDIKPNTVTSNQEVKKVHKSLNTNNLEIQMSKTKQSDVTPVILVANQNFDQQASKVETKQNLNIVASSVERKIAEEIREMKQREEEIRKMREELTKEMQEKSMKVATKVAEVENGKPHVENTPFSTAKSEPEVDDCLKSPTMDIEQTYSIACVFANKRKERSVRSENFENIAKVTSAILHQESPVEREIRIAKEREEELKRERQQALKIKMEIESSFNSSELSVNDKDTDASLSVCSDSSFDSMGKILSPLLKEDDRAESPDSANNNSNGISSSGSFCSLESFSQREKSYNFSGFQKGFRQNTASKDNFSSSSIRSPSPDSSSNSIVSKSGFPFGAQRFGVNMRNKNINMERFIASKGKEIVFKNSSTRSIIGSADYLELKPPQVKKGEEMSQKRFITAASKIQNELREMKEREEELKKERSTVFDVHQKTGQPEASRKSAEDETGYSSMESNNQLNLNSPVEEKKFSNGIKREDNQTNQSRRRSALIDEWEQRIQKSGVQV